ncbi:DUF4381 domain-containing protein [Photobacterium angustum]|uniref:DUF4381 domain-containing protein n=1 Tax=Photobacterium angustum TaxID=661 RepID=A0A2S7VID8_PHOAN|nr:DUF4381 domain-containing protein [Photobacterium angustum]PQJ61956.1 hypothetical protein BTO08_16995 [Photobacterium angustum]
MTTPAPPSSLIKGLVEISIPESVPWIPQTIGWWILIGILLLIVSWKIYCLVKLYIHNRYRREALEDLRLIDCDNPAQACAALFSVIKRVTVHLIDKSAPYEGKALLNLIQTTLPTANNGDSVTVIDPELFQRFSASLWLPDENCLLTPIQVDALKKQCVIWLKTHQRPE